MKRKLEGARCIFCSIVEQNDPMVILGRDENVIVVKDIFPKSKFHYLIIPKKHVKNIFEMDDSETVYGFYLFEMARRIAQSSPEHHHFKFHINNGVNAGQEVPHLHAHFLA